MVIVAGDGTYAIGNAKEEYNLTTVKTARAVKQRLEKIAHVYTVFVVVAIVRCGSLYKSYLHIQF